MLNALSLIIGFANLVPRISHLYSRPSPLSLREGGKIRNPGNEVVV